MNGPLRAECRDRGLDGIEGTAVARERLDRGGRRLAVRLRPRQHVLATLELLVLVGTGDGRRIELVELEAQQVDLAGPGANVAAERGERGVDLGESRPRGAQRLEIDLGEAVERGALGAHAEEALVGVLTVDVDEPHPVLGQGRHRGEATVDVGTRPAVDRDHAGEHDLVVAVGEASLDARLGRAGPDHGRVGSAAHEQADRLDEHGLAGAGLTGEHGEARTDDEVERGDHPEVFDVELDQHALDTSCEFAQRSDRPNLAFRIWWKRRRPNRTKWASAADARKITVSPSATDAAR